MTKSTDLLPVTQADRDAAADLLLASAPQSRWGLADTAFRTGVCDHDPVVQAFARHRISHASVAREDVRRTAVIKLIRDQLASTDYPVSQYECDFADAILALLPAPPRAGCGASRLAVD